MPASLATLERKAKTLERRKKEREKENRPTPPSLILLRQHRPDELQQYLWALVGGLRAGEIRVLPGGPWGSTELPRLQILPEKDFPPAPWTYESGLKAGQPVLNGDRYYTRLYPVSEANEFFAWGLKGITERPPDFDQCNTVEWWIHLLRDGFPRVALKGRSWPATMTFKQTFGSWTESDNFETKIGV